MSKKRILLFAFIVGICCAGYKTSAAVPYNAPEESIAKNPEETNNEEDDFNLDKISDIYKTLCKPTKSSAPQNFFTIFSSFSFLNFMCIKDKDKTFPGFLKNFFNKDVVLPLNNNDPSLFWNFYYFILYPLIGSPFSIFSSLLSFSFFNKPFNWKEMSLNYSIHMKKWFFFSVFFGYEVKNYVFLAVEKNDKTAIRQKENIEIKIDDEDNRDLTEKGKEINLLIQKQQNINNHNKNLQGYYEQTKNAYSFYFNIFNWFLGFGFSFYSDPFDTINSLFCFNTVIKVKVPKIFFSRSSIYNIFYVNKDNCSVNEVLLMKGDNLDDFFSLSTWGIDFCLSFGIKKIILEFSYGLWRANPGKKKEGGDEKQPEQGKISFEGFYDKVLPFSISIKYRLF